MKKLVYSSSFRRDVKKIARQPRKLAALKEALMLLEAEGELPAAYRPHKLAGNYAGCIECHIGPDFLLIWIDEEEDTVYLVRLGSHSELFG